MVLRVFLPSTFIARLQLEPRKNKQHFEPQFELILLAAGFFSKNEIHNNNKNLNADNKTVSINKEISIWQKLFLQLIMRFGHKNRFHIELDLIREQKFYKNYRHFACV